jgi:hypothetical protein
MNTTMNARGLDSNFNGRSFAARMNLTGFGEKS